jgi:hypothetical protein
MKDSPDERIPLGASREGFGHQVRDIVLAGYVRDTLFVRCDRPSYRMVCDGIALLLERRSWP